MIYRKPNINLLLGITKAKRELKRSLGVYQVTKYTNAPRKTKTLLKRKTGYYTESLRIFRLIKRFFK